MTWLDRIFAAAFSPSRLLIAVWKRLGWGSFRLRLRYSAIQRAHYAYGVYFAALHAKRLGLERISVVEMGVAGGNGLLLLEEHAMAVERELGIAIEVYGFDSGVGLPAVADYRDMPYFFKGQAYPMDRAALESRLSRAKLVVGDVRETVARFAQTHRPAPVGFISFDLDLYSSTRDAFGIFNLADDYLLPRVICYFDDLIGPDLFLMNEWLGELLAIREFNAAHENEKIGPIFGFGQKRQFPCPWAEQMFSMHRFNHGLYSRFIGRDDDVDLTLAARPR